MLIVNTFNFFSSGGGWTRDPPTVNTLLTLVTRALGQRKTARSSSLGVRVAPSYPRKNPRRASGNHPVYYVSEGSQRRRQQQPSPAVRCMLLLRRRNWVFRDRILSQSTWLAPRSRCNPLIRIPRTASGGRANTCYTRDLDCARREEKTKKTKKIILTVRAYVSCTIPIHYTRPSRAGCILSYSYLNAVFFTPYRLVVRPGREMRTARAPTTMTTRILLLV